MPAMYDHKEQIVRLEGVFTLFVLATFIQPRVYDTLPFQVFELCMQFLPLPPFARRCMATTSSGRRRRGKRQRNWEEEKKLYEQKKL